jgi:hypothetical protein
MIKTLQVFGFAVLFSRMLRVGQALPFAMCLNAIQQVWDHENGRHHCLPQQPTGLQVEEYAARTHGREPDNLILKEGRSGCVMEVSAARLPITLGGDRAGCIFQPNEYYHLGVAPLTNYPAEVQS